MHSGRLFLASTIGFLPIPYSGFLVFTCTGIFFLNFCCTTWFSGPYTYRSTFWFLLLLHSGSLVNTCTIMFFCIVLVQSRFLVLLCSGSLVLGYSGFLVHTCAILFSVWCNYNLVLCHTCTTVYSLR